MDTSVLIACLVAAIMLIVIAVIFKKAVKGLLFLFLHTGLGWAGLYIFNYVFSFSAFSIGINIASATICGILGLPGLLLLAIVKLIYGG